MAPASIRPELSVSRDAEVTVLVAGLRFSPGSVGWTTPAMEAMVECVRAHHGSVVDPNAEVLLATWDGPGADPARQACRAALAVVSCLRELEQRWRPELPGPLTVGVGIHTGRAAAGRGRSRRRLRVGPMAVVQVAGRLAAATARVPAPVLLTAATLARIGQEFPTRRLGKAVLNHDNAATELYELGGDHANWAGLRDAYEKALAAFEQRDFRTAARTLGNFLLEHPGDGPSLALLSRAAHCLAQDLPASDVVWEGA